MGQITVSGDTLCEQCYLTLWGPLGVDAIAAAVQRRSPIIGSCSGSATAADRKSLGLAAQPSDPPRTS